MSRFLPPPAQTQRQHGLLAKSLCNDRTKLLVACICTYIYFERTNERHVEIWIAFILCEINPITCTEDMI